MSEHIIFEERENSDVSNVGRFIDEDEEEEGEEDDFGKTGADVDSLLFKLKSFVNEKDSTNDLNGTWFLKYFKLDREGNSEAMYIALSHGSKDDLKSVVFNAEEVISIASDEIHTRFDEILFAKLFKVFNIFDLDILRNQRDNPVEEGLEAVEKFLCEKNRYSLFLEFQFIHSRKKLLK